MAEEDTSEQPPPTTPEDAPRVIVERGRPALLAGGAVQSITIEAAETREYWPAMLPDLRPARALLLGAGGGTLAALLSRRFGFLPIVAVDDDPRIVALGRQQFYLGLPNVAVVLADAFAFVAATPGRFDYIAVDLFRGGERPRALVGRPFLTGLRRISNGGIAINLFHDRRLASTISRIERVLTVTRRTDAGKNVVLHCRGR